MDTLPGEASCHFKITSLFNGSGPGCSKLTTLVVNVLLKFQTLVSQIRQYFLLKKCEKLLASLIFQQRISVYLVKARKIRVDLLTSSLS